MKKHLKAIYKYGPTKQTIDRALWPVVRKMRIAQYEYSKTAKAIETMVKRGSAIPAFWYDGYLPKKKGEEEAVGYVPPGTFYGPELPPEMRNKRRREEPEGLMESSVMASSAV